MCLNIMSHEGHLEQAWRSWFLSEDAGLQNPISPRQHSQRSGTIGTLVQKPLKTGVGSCPRGCTLYRMTLLQGQNEELVQKGAKAEQRSLAHQRHQVMWRKRNCRLKRMSCRTWLNDDVRGTGLMESLFSTSFSFHIRTQGIVLDPVGLGPSAASLSFI